MTKEEELELVRKVQAGDTSSFETLVLENQTKVYNLALRTVGNEDDAFDMTQEAFIKAAFAATAAFRFGSIALP